MKGYIEERVVKIASYIGLIRRNFLEVNVILSNKDKLKHFHVHDGSEKSAKNHLALGDGEIDLLDRLALANECNARCVLETKTIEALKKSREWLNESNNSFNCK
jgi:sugar phosphate isomerase/epimerase